MGCVGIVAAAANWWVSRNLYASAQTPVTLTAAEVQDLQSKLDRLAAASQLTTSNRSAGWKSPLKQHPLPLQSAPS